MNESLTHHDTTQARSGETNPGAAFKNDESQPPVPGAPSQPGPAREPDDLETNPGASFEHVPVDD